jgi:hypothetical protein
MRSATNQETGRAGLALSTATRGSEERAMGTEERFHVVSGFSRTRVGGATATTRTTTRLGCGGIIL